MSSETTFDGDIGEFDVSSEAAPESAVSVASEPKEDVISVPKEKWEEVTRTVEDVQREKYFHQTMEAIKSEIPNFDHGRVVEKLKEIHAKDPKKAAEYNTPVGFKLLWHEMSANVATNDPINGGGQKGGGNDFKSVLDGAMQGKSGSLRSAIAMAL